MACENGNPFHDGTGEDFGCKVKHITYNPYSMPSRLNPSAAPKVSEPKWEQTVPTDSRGMPFLDKTGSPMGVKAYGQHRHRIEEQRRKNHQLSTGKS